tara:strand:- start:6128 stop:6643 length:516 start_codon:yes stop_codon:yes gene_type:complete
MAEEETKDEKTDAENPEEPKKEGEGLFYPNRSKKRTQSVKKGVEVGPGMFHPDVSNSEQKASVTPTKGGEDEQTPTSTPETPTADTSPPTLEIPDGFSAHIKPKEGDKKNFMCILDNLTFKDIKYIEFIGKYLLDKGFIKVNHPSQTISFAVTFLLDQIRADIKNEIISKS